MAQAGPRRLQQLAALSIADWGILLLSMLLLPATALALRIKGYTWAREFLNTRTDNHQQKPSEDESRLQEAQRIARLVAIAANHGIYRANCLKKALVARWLLQRRGIDTDLHIGVNKDLETFNAHAWLEYEGNILLDSEDVKQRFSAFDLHSK